MPTHTHTTKSVFGASPRINECAAFATIQVDAYPGYLECEVVKSVRVRVINQSNQTGGVKPGCVSFWTVACTAA